MASKYPPMDEKYHKYFDMLDPLGKMDLEENLHNKKDINDAMRRIAQHYKKTGKIDQMLIFGEADGAGTVSSSTNSGSSSSEKIAIIIPFRESDSVNRPRTRQLTAIVKHFKDFLAGVQYHFYIVEQSQDKRKFNRGALLNIGFQKAVEDRCTVFIFHDVDLLPSEELRPYYIKRPSNNPVHIAAVWNRYNDNNQYFGGIVAFNEEAFEKINGFPNNFWGWGGEDDELLKRVKHYYTVEKAKQGSIQDLENMDVAQKMEYLRVHDAKFMLKREALALHDTTWKHNGLNSLDYDDLSQAPCGPHCTKYTVQLGDMLVSDPTARQEPALNTRELFQKYRNEKGQESKLSPSQQFEQLIQMYFDTASSVKEKKAVPELEVRFGTKGIKPITKNDYDNVVRVLKSLGFRQSNAREGTFYLRARCEFLDSASGRFKMSDVRVEIQGMHAIQTLCLTNDLKDVFKKYPHSVTFIQKRPFSLSEEGGENRVMVRPVNLDDFNCRVSYSTEMRSSKGIEYQLMNNWRKSKKEFRYMNRVTFEHPDWPFQVDLSIVKTGNMGKDKRGFSHIVPVYTIEESGVFSNKETYEIELEFNNQFVHQMNPKHIANALRKGIKYVLCGLQQTMYPVSYAEQQSVLQDYMKLIWENEYDPSKRVHSSSFIGPNSITLQLPNVAPLNDTSVAPNIRKDFVVTDKADGERHLLYVSKTGKMYLISTNMDVKFTGAKTLNEQCFHTLLDGELITTNRRNEPIQLYAAFDIYYHKGKDVRSYSFLLREEEKDVYKSRYYLLEKINSLLDPVSIVENTSSTANATAPKTLLSPIRCEVKKFYPMSDRQSIFEGCKLLLEKEKQALFEYEIDGLIFTHAFYGVGSNVIGKAGPKTKVTWEYSFKWKPPQYNTIDFLVTTMKDETGQDVVKTIYEEGINLNGDHLASYHSQYKMVELRCGFSEKNDGFMNPCQDILDDHLPEFKPRVEEKPSNDYVPKRFYPTEPYDPNAGICRLFLLSDDRQMMTKNNEVITDNTIVEFSYDTSPDIPEGFRWVPLRVRYDKTAKLMRGEREYGNSYRVCNENWKSIHPSGRITEEMLMTGEGIPDVLVTEDIYYNTPSGKFQTEALKNFHNLYVKKLLICGAAKQGDTLIDFACGKAGDLSKWIAAKVSFVFGIDYSRDNLENRLDGACARYLTTFKTTKHMPHALFVHGNSSFNIRDGSAMMNDKAKQITAAVFGRGPKEVDRLGRGVARQYGKGESGFHVASCQFALHYFFETPDTLRGFLKNVAECTKLHGYFIGTSYDGKAMFRELKKIQPNERIELQENGKKIWEVVKHYSADTFEDDSSCIGYKICVYQESINQCIYEYLVNYDYLVRLMENYGFVLVSREEAHEMGLPASTGLFNELFTHMLEEIKKYPFKSKMFGEAPRMTPSDKRISFLNRYFVFKKVREVHVDKIALDFGEYQPQETAVAEDVTDGRAKQASVATILPTTTKTNAKPRARKLTQKLELIPATEAVDDAPLTAAATAVVKSAPVPEVAKRDAVRKPPPKKKQPAFIILDDDIEDLDAILEKEETLLADEKEPSTNMEGIEEPLSNLVYKIFGKTTSGGRSKTFLDTEERTQVERWILRCKDRCSRAQLENILADVSGLVLRRSKQVKLQRNDQRQDFIAEKIIRFLQSIRPTVKPSAMHFLDVGGGNGNVLSTINTMVHGQRSTSHKAQFVSMEPSPEHGMWTETYPFDNTNVTYAFWDGKRFPQESNSMDVILCMVSLHHMTEETISHAMEEMYRVLKPDGVVLIKEHDAVHKRDLFMMDWEHHLYHVLDNAYEDKLVKPEEYLQKSIHNFHPKSYWRNEMEKHGFHFERRTSRFLDGGYVENDPKNPTNMYWDVYFKR